MSNKEIILKEFEELKGQFVITTEWKLERLVAIAEDEHDYYYVTYNGRGLKFNTCVGGLIRLKGYIMDKDYNELERTADLNHHDRLLLKSFKINFHEKSPPNFPIGKSGTPNFPTIEDYKKSLVSEWGKTDKLLTDIIFTSDNK